MISDIGIEMKFVLLLLLCVCIRGDAKVRCIEREREALLSFKNSIIDETGILSSWLPSTECCNWYGVVCSNNTAHVIHLELGAAHLDIGLGGKVSSSLLELHHLTYLDLSHNDFGHNPIPEFIGSMKHLQHLNLRESRFSGTVPPQLGNLTNLRTLDLTNNYLSSDNLNWLSRLLLLSYLGLTNFSNLNRTNWLQQILNLRSLRELHLPYCNIGDANLSPLVFANSSSTSLSTLDLSNNDLTTSTFSWLSNINSSLVKISLSGNNLSGRITDVFETFNQLEYLDVCSNILEGDIPKSLSNLTQLRVLVLCDNEFRGELDEFIGNLPSRRTLEILDLARNQLSGSVPDLTSFSALTEVYLGSNKLMGSMPLSVGQLSRLRVLEVSGNNLEGILSESHFIKLHHLKILDLSFTSLNVQITPDWSPPFQLDYMFLAGCKVGPSFPKWIQTQTNLSHLDLSSTGLTDDAPFWLWSFSPSLSDLFLSNNQISGTIPHLSSTSIETIALSSNKFSGAIPLFSNHSSTIELSQNMFGGSISSICKIPYKKLWLLGLSNNQFSGEIPDCWQKMPKLWSLDLANNGFMGMIPHSVSYLYDLRGLQLHGNNLSGELFSTLRFCQELTFIDVGENQLTGEIPAWIDRIYNIEYLNLGSNRFYGSIPPGICNLTRIRVLDIGLNNLSGKIPDCFYNFTVLEQTDTSPSVYVIGFAIFIEYNPQLPNLIGKYFKAYSLVGWKGQEKEYRENLDLLRLVDFSSNKFIGNIPDSISTMKGVRSLNLSRNHLTGNIIQDIGQMKTLESLDLSNNQLSGEIPTSLAQLQSLSFLDLSNNNLCGKIPSSTQLQSFDTSSYAGNSGLCGSPLSLCPEDAPRPPPTTTGGGREDEPSTSRLSFMQECGISVAFGFTFGFWGVVGSFVLKKSWRYAFFNLVDATGDWLYVTTAIFLSKWTRS